MKNEVFLKKATPGDLVNLQAFCKKIYPVYFKGYWEEPGLELYLEEQFGTEKLNADLKDENVGYFFIQNKKQQVGFLKINYAPTSKSFDEKVTCELEKIYILPECKGQGIGSIVLNNVIELGRKKSKDILFLCVLDTNPNATSFYEKSGFRFHHKSQLTYAHFKSELKGLDYLYLELN